MVKYKVQPTGKLAPTPSVTQPGAVSGYVHATYEVVETETNQVIKTDLTKNEAKSMCRHLNFGGGFDGFTPGFFLNIPGKLHFEEDYFYK
jgi:hypothetical protein